MPLVNNGSLTKRTQDRVLSAMAINGFIICLRKLIKAGKSGDETYYKTKLRGIDTFNFSRFRSSQYGKMSDDLFDTFFK